jgi:hypothetical protein
MILSKARFLYVKKGSFLTSRLVDTHHFRSAVGDQEGQKTTDFIRYSTVDRPPSQLPQPHASGQQYKHRERYAVKTRSRLISHEKPDVFKQYVWKPPKENTEPANSLKSTASTSISTEAGPNSEAEAGPSTNVDATSPPPKKKRKSTPKKVRPAADMTKF